MDIHSALLGFRRNGDLRGADCALREWAANSGKISDRWLAVHSLAVFALDEFRFIEALVYCSELLEIDPSDAGTHGLRSTALRYVGDLDGSEKAIHAAIHLALAGGDPNLYDYQTDLCYVLLEQNRLYECEQLALSDWPSSHDDAERIGYFTSTRRLVLLARLSRSRGRADMWAEYARRANRLIHLSGRQLPLGECIQPWDVNPP